MCNIPFSWTGTLRFPAGFHLPILKPLICHDSSLKIILLLFPMRVKRVGGNQMTINAVLRISSEHSLLPAKRIKMELG